ncbi:MAG: hypothetical protein QXL94_01510 [Candidatus Parvarchaeum sp.]
MAIENRNVRVFLYRVTTPKNNTFPNNFYEKFKLDEIERNVQEWNDTFSLVLVLDKPNIDSITGRFVKLRSDAPQKIGLLKKIEQDIELNSAEKEYIEEVSNFVWFYNDDRFLGEYNHFAMRVFHSPLSYYIRKQMAFSETEFKVEAEPIADLFAKIKRDEYFGSVELKLKRESMASMESRGLSLGRRLSSLSEDPKAMITKGIAKPKRMSKQKAPLQKNSVVSFIEDLLPEKDNFEEMLVETESGTFDLIRGALVSEKLVVEYVNRRINRSDFYRVAREYFDSHRDVLA